MLLKDISLRLSFIATVHEANTNLHLQFERHFLPFLETDSSFWSHKNITVREHTNMYTYLIRSKKWCQRTWHWKQLLLLYHKLAAVLMMCKEITYASAKTLKQKVQVTSKQDSERKNIFNRWIRRRHIAVNMQAGDRVQTCFVYLKCDIVYSVFFIDI